MFPILTFLFAAKLLEELIAYSKLYSQNIGHHFTRLTIRVSAMTGAAATEIGGDTTAREFGLCKVKDHANYEDLQAFQDTRLCIVDEISFAEYHRVLQKLSNNLKAFTECPEWQYGKVALVFLGDFCQLEPIGKDPIYLQDNGILWQQSLTAMVELKGTHRYKNCAKMARIMPGIRENGLSESDMKILNTRVVDGRRLKMPPLNSTRFATFFNKSRSRINSAVFLEYLKKYHANVDQSNIPRTGIVIKGQVKWAGCQAAFTFEQRKVLYEQCCEADIKGNRRKRADPFLCLFSGCDLMGTMNEDVKNGIANGTTGKFRKIKFKPGKVSSPIQVHGYWIHSINIEDVEYLELEWSDSQFQGRFRVEPMTAKFRVQFPIVEFGETMKIPTEIDLVHFPVVLNHATTGHKLQGKSVDSLVISEWSKVKNWAYVVLSRVRTLERLFLLKPIPRDIDFDPKPEYLRMMENLRTSILALPEDVNGLRAEFNNLPTTV
jgi:hypothetical protein